MNEIKKPCDFTKSFSVADLAYAAGIMDGEGCVTVIRGKKDCPEYWYYVQAIVKMVDEDSVLWLFQTFGGSYGLYRPAKFATHPHHHNQHRWCLYGRNVAHFLELILPFLKVKKRRAELAIELARMARTRGGGRGYRYGQNPITPEESEKRRVLAFEIRNLNQRSNGRVAPCAKWGT